MPATKVVVAEARMVDATSTITVVGTVEPVRRSRVGSEAAGIVREMPVRQGDLVQAGGTLCVLEDDTLRFRLAEQQARLNELRARHEELLAGSRKEELARLKAILDEATAQHERWKFEMERIKNLYAGRDSNDKEYQDTRAEFLAAERRMAAAQAAYDLAVAGPRKEVIAQAACAVDQQQAVVNRTESDLSKCAVHAPFTGHIVERATEVGEWIPVGGTVVEMVELSSVLVRVDVPESALPYLSVGDSARVKVDALLRSFEGRIKHIMPQADPRARTFPIEVEIDNGDGLLAGGMFARATVPAGPSRQAVAVPKDAIVQREGVNYVAALVPDGRGGQAGLLSPVTLGVDVGGWITITSGDVRPGSPVITRGTERILPFPLPVQIVDETGTLLPTPREDAAPTAGGDE